VITHPSADDHPSKPKCLFELSWLFGRVGNHADKKRLLIHALELERRRGNDAQVIRTLQYYLFNANRLLDLYKEGTRQAREAMEISRRINDTVAQAESLNFLAWVLSADKQLDASEKSASRAICFVSGKNQEYLVCHLHRILGLIHQSKGEKGKANHDFRTARASESHPLSTGTMNCFGSITLWLPCIAMKTSSTTQTPTSDEQSYTLSMTHTSWVARCKCRLMFGIGNAGLKKQDRRPCTRLRYTRSSGLRGMW
jgi:hypothetical protein